MTIAALAPAPAVPLLKELAGYASMRPMLLLLGDTGAAILFAAGLAGAVATVAAGDDRIVRWITLIILAGGLRGVAAMVAVRTGARDARVAKAEIRARVVAALFRPRAGHGSIGALVNSAVDEVEALDGHVARFLPARRAAAIAPLVVGSAIAVASPVAAIILLLTLLPFIAAMILAGGAAAAESRRQFDALAHLSIRFADRLRALPVLLAFGAVPRETEGIADASRTVARRTMRVLRVAFVSSAALEFFAALSVALVAVYAGFNLLGLLPVAMPEHLTLFRAFFVLALAPEFYAPMRRLAAAYHDRQAAKTASVRLDAVLAGQMPVAAGWTPTVTTLPRVTFTSVTIRYPGADVAAVEDFTLDIAPGETVAITGASGSGKSSLLHALLGLAPISAGTLAVDGIVLPGHASLATLASWSGQNPLLLPGTIAETIALSDPAASRARIVAAAAAAGLGPARAQRAGGLEATIDAHGSGLSGGERRRIGLARAILKPAPLLLLDEPTAHLDVEAEAALIETIRHTCRGRTTLIATHSPALAAIADRVIRLDER